MDKKQALTEGLKLWTILAQTGGSEKKDVPGPWQDYVNRCPCCEYADEDCDLCPIVWINDRSCDGCCGQDSPYRAWMKAETSESRRFFAKRIVDLHKKALERHKNDNQKTGT